MSASAPFGQVLTAMVTPMHADGSLDLDGAQALASALVDAGNDGLVISGTTGESPTTSDDEKTALLRAVVAAVGQRCTVLAGVGSPSTEHSTVLARAAELAGADGLLLVTPYYNKPPQAGVLAHVRAVASAVGLPVMLYDIPARTGLALETATLLALAEHPQVVAVKDAKLDLEASSTVIAQSALAFYSGHDPMTLPLLSIGAVGVVGTSTHVSAGPTRALVEAFLRGDVDEALALHQRLLPIYRGIFRTQGTILVKAALRELGLPAGPVRLPLVEATPGQVAQLRLDLASAGLQPVTA